jgi:hypothetical protein
MALDLFHWFGNDLEASPSGDLLLSSGTVNGQQNLIRRLMTPAQAYIFEVTYGAGLSQFIGTPTALLVVQGLIRAQLYLEQAVAQTPTPSVTVTAIANGLNVVIQYVDAQTGAPAMLNFNVND